MHPAIRAIKKSTAPQYVLLGNFTAKESDIESDLTQMITITSNSFILTDPKEMRQIMISDLFEVFPEPLLAILTLSKLGKDIIFSID